MNGQPTAQNTPEAGADGELPAFFIWSIAELARRRYVERDELPHWTEPTHALQIFRFAEVLRCALRTRPKPGSPTATGCGWSPGAATSTRR